MSDPISISVFPGMLKSSSARVMSLGNFKVVMSMTEEDMLAVKLGKMKHVTTLQ
jgi:hypothetical protein